MLKFGKSTLLGKTISEVTEYVDGDVRIDFNDETWIDISGRISFNK